VADNELTGALRNAFDAIEELHATASRDGSSVGRYVLITEDGSGTVTLLVDDNSLSVVSTSDNTTVVWQMQAFRHGAW
jgi:hypothetical protein